MSVNGWRLLFSTLVVVALAWALAPLWLALLLSVLFYLLLEPAVARLMANGVPQGRAIILALTPPMLLLGLGSYYMVSLVRAYLPQLPHDLQQLQYGLLAMLNHLELILASTLPLKAPLSQQLASLDVSALDIDSLMASSSVLANIAVNISLVPPLAFFMLRDYRHLRDRLLNLLPNSQFELGWLIYFRVSERMQAYLRGLLLQQLILASITSVGFWLAGFPSPILLGVLTGISGLVPYLGPALAMAAPLVILLSDTAINMDMLWQALLVLAIGFGFDNLVVIPLLVAGSVNLHPAVALVAVVVAGHVGGVAGMILVIPVLGMARILVESIYRGLKPEAAAGSSA